MRSLAKRSKEKLNSHYYDPYRILTKVGEVAY